jgi:hypothetical protein
MKIKTDFTPGPWKTVKDNIGFSVADYIKVPCEHVDGQEMHVRLGEKEYGWSTKESEANARLIAAAPEMFQMLVDFYFNPGMDGIKKMKNIIEKVTGKTIAELEKEE